MHSIKRERQFLVAYHIKSAMVSCAFVKQWAKQPTILKQARKEH